MSTPITPPEMVQEHREHALAAKVAAREVARTLGSLTYAAQQHLTHKSEATESWYQRCYDNALAAHRTYREITAQLFR